jgi:hypothetical protein
VARSGATTAVPPPLPPGVGRGRPAVNADEPDDAAVEAVDAAGEQTEKWAAVADAAAAEAAQARAGAGRVADPLPQNLCVTVASRIPEMLAESMSLAGDDEPKSSGS